MRGAVRIGPVLADGVAGRRGRDDIRFATTQITLALRVAHRGYVLEVGNIVFSERSEALLKNDAIRKAYLGEG